MTLNRLLVLGGTGAVGSAVLKQALENDIILEVIAPTRRPLPAHPKLINPQLDFDNLPLRFDGASLALQQAFTCDAVICALGSTLKQAGSKEAFAAIDKTLVLELARLAQAGGAKAFALNSSLGASLSGSFYLRIKAEVEQAVLAMSFERTIIVRPSLIDAKRDRSRPLEHVGLVLFRMTKPLIPRRYRAVTPEAIARSLINGITIDKGSKYVIESENIS